MYYQTIVALSTVVAAIVLLAYPLVVTQTQAQCLAAPDCDKNPTSGNPHPHAIGVLDKGNPLGTETGNPHSQSCTGDPHGQVSGVDACQGSK
ncbi:MAG: hypothetical protein WA364_07810 [Candidatus Nitrosopolaris sp.]